jgi:hypothetical protein
MADFRRWFTVLAVLALMAFAASAQIGTAVPGGTANSAFACNATAAGTPQLRPEGFTELVGDIVISCTGGQLLQVGAAIPTTNITVYLTGPSAITSRYMSSNGASDALLIIDEAGSGINTGAPGFGPQAPQTLCSTSNQQAVGGSTCGQFVGSSNGYEVGVTAAGGSTPSANVYQGKIGDFGAASVTFYAVPVMPPATTGVTRTYRITNIRAPVVGLTGGTFTAILSTNGPTALPVAGTAINVGVVGNLSKAAIKQASTPFQQCIGVPVTTPKLTANLIFTEGFATAFKTRVVPGGIVNAIPGNSSGNQQYFAEATNTAAPYNQNIPGGLYGGFAQNSESGFIFPTLTTSTSSGNYVAGLADYGTRLKAVFTNVPSGLTLYVSVTSSGTVASNTAPAIIGGTSVIPYAVLVSTGSGEANADNSATAAFTPVAGTTTGSDGLSAIALSANSSGAYVAVWEVTNSNPSATDTLSFSAYVAYSPQSSSGAVGSSTFYGLPITGLPTGAPVNNVQLSLAPEPGGGTFSASTLQGTLLPIPRFILSPPANGQWATINLCQTTLLYPFVTGAAGFDTGIAVANTSWDPFKTVNQTGSCTLYAYGVTVATAGNTAIQSVVSGCDQFANPIPGTNCFPIVPPGQVQSVQASAVLTNFQGYVIALCNFQYAHGYAALTDLGLRNLWSSYLALELGGPSSVNLTSGAVSGGVGSPRSGVQSIEQLVH